MTFDPTKPADHSLIAAGELRDQFNALQEEITNLQQQVTQLFPVLTFDQTAGVWNVTYAGPPPGLWEIWMRSNNTPSWSAAGTCGFPTTTDSILGGDEIWWQVKIAGLTNDAQHMTPFSNVISGGSVPALAPVLTANNATMSLDWTYSGPAGDEFFIFAHQPNDASGVFNDIAHVRGDLRTWATDFDDPADAVGYKYYIVPVDGADNPLTQPSNTVNFAAG
jgi:hypothetical protein